MRLTPPRPPALAGELERLRAAQLPMLEKLRERLLMSRLARGTLPTGVRWWIKYCVYGRKVSPIRTVDEHSPRAEKLEEEILLMDFVVWLVACRPSGRRILADTAMKYVYSVQAWLDAQPTGGGRIGGGMELSRLRGLIRGMKRQLGDAETKPRYGVRTQHLEEAMRRQLSGGSADEANWRAALATGFCALMRGGEIGVSDGNEWSAALHLTRADLSFFHDEEGVLHAVIMMRPLKKSPGARKTVPVVMRAGGSMLDPVAELCELVRRDPVAPEDRANTPLFRDVGSGRAFRVSEVRRVVKWLMGAIGQDAVRFGAHSLRIGGATAALAGGVQPGMIRLLGRWSSDVAEVYSRMSRQAASKFTVVVGSTGFDDLERHTFRTEELEVLPSEWMGMAYEPDLFEEFVAGDDGDEDAA